ncbi:thioredoxin family protein [bacterium]|nr:MAG: thioredoxin family protein [bacterium]
MNHARIIFAVILAVAWAVPAMAGPEHDHHDGHATGHAVGHQPGQMAPDFELADQTGITHRLSDYRGQIVVLEWTNPTCPFVQRHYTAGNTTMLDTQASFADDGVVWLGIDSSNYVTAESASAWAGSKEISWPILLDAAGDVGRMYEARTTPHMFVIGRDGKVLYNGAIDDDPRGQNDEVNNYVEAALTAALAGDAVEMAQTRPYGCSVKYAPASSK